MSFEHKYLKYKQKYLELKEQLATLQQKGGASNSDSVLDLVKLTETPNNDVEQLGGYLINSTESSVLKNSETESEMNNINELTETPEDNQMVVNLDSSEDQSNETNIESEKEESEKEESEKEESKKEQSEKEESEKEESEKESSSDDDQEGGNLDTSISELDGIFSQLGGKKKNNDSSDSDSSMTSLSDIEDSSDFDL